MLARSEGSHAARDPDIVDLVEQALTSAPLDSLGALAALRDALGALERRQVARALERGATFAELAAVLGISRQAAHRRYRALAQPEPQPPLTLEPAQRGEPEITRAARAALGVARDEAARQGTATIDSGHLLFGAIATADGIVARRLRRIGATVEALRRPARGAPAPRPGFDRALRAALTGDDELDLDRLLRVALDAPDGRALALLEQLSVSPAGLLGAYGHPANR
jgi:Clp amino terminal domain, pathogenicity island component